MPNSDYCIHYIYSCFYLMGEGGLYGLPSLLNMSNMFEKIEWWHTIYAALGVAGTALYNWFKSIRVSKRDDFEAVLKVWQEDNERLRRKEEENERLISELRDEVAALRHKIELLESAHQSLPLPMWLKDLDGTMLAVNHKFERELLAPSGIQSQKYIGKRDHEVWPKEIADQFVYSDNKVKETRQVCFTEEYTIDSAGKKKYWSVIKYPRMLADVMVGIGGIAFPREYLFKTKNNDNNS